jgi:hypothetical protein
MAEIVAFVTGATLVGLILIDIFLTIVVPRRAPSLGRQLRLSSIFVPHAWRVWKYIGFRFSSADRREGFLGMFGALAVVLLLDGWVVLLILGYGLMLFALREEMRPSPDSLGAAIYYAGVSLLTVGYGDIVALDWPARVISLVAAGNGLGLFAMVITLLFTLYGSFQRREQAVVVLEAGASAPPSGVTLLETYAHAGILDDLPRVFEAWQFWAAEVLDSHLAYPILAYFRSSHDNDSWISSLGAVMDAATLVLTTLEDGPKGWAKLSRAVGSHCLEDLVQNFGLEDEREVGVERAEFDEARHRLARAGFALQDADESWANFSMLRSEYAGRVNALARYWATPPAQWIGDRSPLRGPRLHREQPRIEVGSGA